MHNTLAEQLTGGEVDPRQVLSPYWFGNNVKYGSGRKPYRMWHESRSGKCCFWFRNVLAQKPFLPYPQVNWGTRGGGGTF